MKNYLVLGLILMGLTACGGDGADKVSVSDAIAQASAIMAKTVPKATPQSFTSTFSVGFSSIYTNGDYGLGGDFGDSPAEFLAFQGDSTEQGGLMYRFTQAVEQNVCMFAYFLPSTDGIIDISDGAQLRTITSAEVTGEGATAIQTACPKVSLDTLNHINQNSPFLVRYHVEDISGLEGSEYERKVSFDIGNLGTFQDFYYYTLNTDVVKFVYVESKALEGDKGGSYAAFSFDVGADKASFEYVSLGDPGQTPRFDIYRAFYDGGANYAGYLARNNQGTDKSVAHVSTLPNQATELAVSFDISVTVNNLAVNAVTDANACVSSSDLSLVVGKDNTLTCAGVTGLNASGFTAETSFITLTKASIGAVDHASTIQFSTKEGLLTGAPVQ